MNLERIGDRDEPKCPSRRGGRLWENRHHEEEFPPFFSSFVVYVSWYISGKCLSFFHFSASPKTASEGLGGGGLSSNFQAQAKSPQLTGGTELGTLPWQGWLL